MSAPTSYDASSPNEQAPALPSAPPTRIGPCSVLQPPLSRRGSGPGLVLILPNPKTVKRAEEQEIKPLDPEPIQKWAEEGFAVVAITLPENVQNLESEVIVKIEQGVTALKAHISVDVKHKFGLIVYKDTIISLVDDIVRLRECGIAAIITFEEDLTTTTTVIPHHAHLNTPKDGDLIDSPTTSFTTHKDTRPNFILPYAAAYDPTAASLAHTQSLSFLRKHLGGPTFDLEAIWDEHTYWEFEKRSVAQTMATMVAEPYVNRVPTMTGGMGREKLTAFYRDHFIFCNPPDTALKPISRTVGPDRVVDEFIFSCTHTSHIPWLLPNVPPTNTHLTIPIIAVINVRGDRLYHEHIWWDQATVLRQAGILPTHLPFDGHPSGMLKLPVAGSECARLLADERGGKSNEMIGEKS